MSKQEVKTVVKGFHLSLYNFPPKGLFLLPFTLPQYLGPLEPQLSLEVPVLRLEGLGVPFSGSVAVSRVVGA